MKVLYIHQYFATPESVGGTRSYEMARRLVRDGHEVVMLTSSAFLPPHWKSPRGWTTKEFDGIKLLIYHLPYSNLTPFYKRVLIFLKFMIVATFKGARQSCDIVFGSSTPLTVAVPGVMISKFRRIPFVFEVRDLWPEIPISLGILNHPVTKWVAQRLEKWAYRNAAHIVSLSPGISEGVIAVGEAPQKISLIPNAADVDRFSVGREAGQQFKAKYSWLADRPLVVYVGTFGYVNNLSYLIEVASVCLRLNEKICFVLIGDGDEKVFLQDYARRLGVLNRNIFILPSIPKQEIPSVLSAADFCISTVLPNPVLWRNSANKFFDALAAGRPIAINYRGWQAELIDEEGCGVVLEHDNVQVAAQTLVEKIENLAWCANARVNARLLAEKSFDRETLYRKLERTLGRVLSDYSSEHLT
ncbi:glycosyltransferase family 4 protein [Desulfuromonas acetoxidans]|uniref:Glycosyl transferase, group 1 n=1 Tax=Desulfuromonas acetoxidans (strain DSM 684 / 11070) TaxID=281689 RepID=Q1K181_DESA6|nr:glycosyltransferase family 4 protein [Desulfuromonas acetoxidans]EAT16127.1 glycosyl transferase, group 1 [Desulfuromonas acetoxidans DSM 684]MBF0646433.1 glycosyltransferase family 4 protein [Desulfuromonas acetoxidans]NVD25520.1 glycosyltransferase family 4 protein [Desulfuromonas acetoxidans]NVE17530.1 glycosyltransferase family 4 protein [Desulfuromonas acetoxidans]